MTATQQDHKFSVTLVLRDGTGKKLRRVRIYMNDPEQADRLMAPHLSLSDIRDSTIEGANLSVDGRANTGYSEGSRYGNWAVDYDGWWGTFTPYVYPSGGKEARSERPVVQRADGQQPLPSAGRWAVVRGVSEAGKRWPTFTFQIGADPEQEKARFRAWLDEVNAKGGDEADERKGNG